MSAHAGLCALPSEESKKKDALLDEILEIEKKIIVAEITHMISRDWRAGR